MSWGDVWKIVLASIASMGGIGVVVFGVIKFAGNHIAERLARKYELKLSKELEAFKGARDKKVYISKTRFDAEFQIYRELSGSFFKLLKDCSFVHQKGRYVPSNVDNINEYIKREDIKCYNAFVSSMVEAQDMLYKNSPFIEEGFNKMFVEILELCRKQDGEFNKLLTRQINIAFLLKI